MLCTHKLAVKIFPDDKRAAALSKDRLALSYLLKCPLQCESVSRSILSLQISLGESNLALEVPVSLGVSLMTISLGLPKAKITSTI